MKGHWFIKTAFRRDSGPGQDSPGDAAEQGGTEHRKKYRVSAKRCKAGFRDLRRKLPAGTFAGKGYPFSGPRDWSLL
jgi:hypothetical protein